MLAFKTHLGFFDARVDYSFIRGSLFSCSRAVSQDGTDVGHASPHGNDLNVAQRLISPLGSPQFLSDAVFI